MRKRQSVMGPWCHRAKRFPPELTAAMMLFFPPLVRSSLERLRASTAQKQRRLFPKAISHLRHAPISHRLSRTCTCKLSPSWQCSHTFLLHFISPPKRHADESPPRPSRPDQPGHARAVINQQQSAIYVVILLDHLRTYPRASVAPYGIACDATWPAVPCLSAGDGYVSEKRVDHRASSAEIKRAELAFLSAGWPCNAVP
ncbi:hypothetical protein V8C26DRAFT_113265 [Trichoderma gracile]